jgi:hypothetical protein
MRTIITFLLIGIAATAAAQQPQLFDQAVIATRAVLTNPDGTIPIKPAETEIKEESPGVRKIMLGKRSDEPGETLCTTWYKEKMFKTEVKTTDWRCVTIRDNAAQQTQSFIEIMEEAAPPQAALSVPSSQVTLNQGLGFYASDAEMWAYYTKMTGAAQPDTAMPAVDIAYENETKDIADYPCRKAVVTVTPPKGAVKKITVWYNTQVKLADLSATGDPACAGIQVVPNTRLGILSQLPGFVMEYELKYNSGQVLNVQVTKLTVNKKVPGREFKVPGNIAMKPLQEYGKQTAINAEIFNFRRVENAENGRPIKLQPGSGRIFDF